MAKIVTLSNLQEFKTKYDAYLATYVKDEISKAVFSSGYNYKGSKTVAELNALSGQVAGDVYNVTSAGTLSAGSVVVSVGDNVAWTGTVWNKLAGVIDTSSFVTTSGNQIIGGHKTFSDTVTFGSFGLEFSVGQDTTYITPAAGGRLWYAETSVDYETIAFLSDLSGYVPYTGATGNVNVGSHSLIGQNVIARGGGVTVNSGANVGDPYVEMTVDNTHGTVVLASGTTTQTGSFSINPSYDYTTPTESGTLIVGTFATNAEVDALFS